MVAICLVRMAWSPTAVTGSRLGGMCWTLEGEPPARAVGEQLR